jgi:hypothetical protein
MKNKETLEEAAENYANKKGHIPTTELEDAIFKQGFLDGAKWQAERMYSEKDMIEFAAWVYRNRKCPLGKKRTNKELFKEWFEQFKKK